MRLTGYPVFFLTVSWLKKSGGLNNLTSGAGIDYGQRKEVGTLSLQLPMDLGVEHQVNSEVNL